MGYISKKVAAYGQFVLVFLLGLTIYPKPQAFCHVLNIYLKFFAGHNICLNCLNWNKSFERAWLNICRL